MQKADCLDDLTTGGTRLTGHTNPNDWSGLHASGIKHPTGVPGIQVDGYFPNSSHSNTNTGGAHDSQFVIRLKRAMRRVELTGHLGRPMLTLHGTLDALLPPRTDSEVYDRMVDRAGSGRLHGYYSTVDGDAVYRRPRNGDLANTCRLWDRPTCPVSERP